MEEEIQEQERALRGAKSSHDSAPYRTVEAINRVTSALLLLARIVDRWAQDTVE